MKSILEFGTVRFIIDGETFELLCDEVVATLGPLVPVDRANICVRCSFAAYDDAVADELALLRSAGVTLDGEGWVNNGKQQQQQQSFMPPPGVTPSPLRRHRPSSNNSSSSGPSTGGGGGSGGGGRLRSASRPAAHTYIFSQETFEAMQGRVRCYESAAAARRERLAALGIIDVHGRILMRPSAVNNGGGGGGSYSNGGSPGHGDVDNSSGQPMMLLPMLHRRPLPVLRLEPFVSTSAPVTPFGDRRGSSSISRGRRRLSHSAQQLINGTAGEADEQHAQHQQEQGQGQSPHRPLSSLRHVAQRLNTLLADNSEAVRSSTETATPTAATIANGNNSGISGIIVTGGSSGSPSLPVCVRYSFDGRLGAPSTGPAPVLLGEAAFHPGAAAAQPRRHSSFEARELFNAAVVAAAVAAAASSASAASTPSARGRRGSGGSGGGGADLKSSLASALDEVALLNHRDSRYSSVTSEALAGLRRGTRETRGGGGGGGGVSHPTVTSAAPIINGNTTGQQQQQQREEEEEAAAAAVNALECSVASALDEVALRRLRGGSGRTTPNKRTGIPPTDPVPISPDRAAIHGATVSATAAVTVGHREGGGYLSDHDRDVVTRLLNTSGDGLVDPSSSSHPHHHATATRTDDDGTPAATVTVPMSAATRIITGVEYRTLL